MNMPSGKQIAWAVVVLALVLAAAFLGVKYPLPPQPEEQPAAAAYQVPCHTEMGGVGYTCDSGGAITVGSGASLAVASGATFTNAAAAAFSNVFSITAPTTVVTTTPALSVNNLGAANDALVLAKAGTPVFKVGNSGSVTGYVLQYGSTGKKGVCSSTTITGTGTIAHGLATPSVALASLAGDVTGNGARVSTTNAAGTVTVKIWNSALTPA